MDPETAETSRRVVFALETPEQPVRLGHIVNPQPGPGQRSLEPIALPDGERQGPQARGGSDHQSPVAFA